MKQDYSQTAQELRRERHRRWRNAAIRDALALTLIGAYFGLILGWGLL
jgi:predicted trehalose synthase